MLHREIVILPNMHFAIGVIGGIMIGLGKSDLLLTPSKIAEPIVDTDSDEARVSSDVSQLREDLKVCQGCHNLNCTARQPVVMSQTVQFCPVPLTKRMPERVGQVNRFNSQ
jgi:hypothetical protein